MRICQVAPCFPYKEHLMGGAIEPGYHIGGVERHIYEISKALKGQGHTVTVLTTRSPKHADYYESDELEVIRLPYGISLYSSSVPLSLFKHLKGENYDVIHAHTPNPMIADLACIANKGRLPFILTYHNDITKGGLAGSIISNCYNATSGRYLLSRSNAIITTTMGYAKRSPRLRSSLNKVKVIPNGINPGTFGTIKNNSDIRTKYGIPHDAKVILFVGTLAEYKGIRYLISAFSQVLRTKSNTYLLIVGSGGLRQALEEQANNLGVIKNVVFTGYVGDQELPFVYSASDIFVLPSVSEMEGFGIVQLEAMASGKPVISSNLPGVRDVDPDEVATVHIPPMDIDSLASALLTILSDQDLARKMGERGKNLVFEKYTWHRIAQMTMNVYGEVRS